MRGIVVVVVFVVAACFLQGCDDAVSIQNVVLGHHDNQSDAIAVGHHDNQSDAIASDVGSDFLAAPRPVCTGDKSRLCSRWAQQGYCLRQYVTYMQNNCCASCAVGSGIGKTCQAVWNVDANGYSCGARVEWLKRNEGMSDGQAKTKVADEFPNQCGACKPKTCQSVWNIDANGYSCGARIEWLKRKQGMSDAQAKNAVANEFPNQCGACKPGGATSKPVTTTQPSGGAGRRGPELGPLMTTRYWDCCKPSCGWPGKARFSKPAMGCKKDGKTPADANARSGCDKPQSWDNSFMCTSSAPWYDPVTRMSYGTAAGNIQGGAKESDFCCACYKLHFHGKPPMIVQLTNIGGDLHSSHFDILAPGGGFGLFDGCTYQHGASEAVWGDRFGGVMKRWGKSAKDKCNAMPSDLREGCRWSFDHLGDNPQAYSHYRVKCPAELLRRSGCKRDDEDSFSTGSGSGCCSWDGSSCGNCGKDGAGWCHQSSGNCAKCNGNYLSKQPPQCR